MDLFGLLWDLRQQRRLDDNERELDETHIRLNNVADNATALKQEVDLLLMVIGALVDVLQSKGVASEVEIRDAILRSRKAHQVRRPDVCANCRRGYNLKLDRCVYCGHVNRDESKVQPGSIG